MTRLNGKIALITGAARGIGEAIARAFIQEDAVVYLTDIETDAGEAVARSLGKRAMFRRLDVREEHDWAHVTAEGLSSHGRLDVVVNNAGITGFESGFVAHDPENASLDDWRAVAVGAFGDPTFPAPARSSYEPFRHPWVKLPDEMERS